MKFCPKDQSLLSFEQKKEISHFKCDDCAGIWLPHSYLAALTFSWQFSVEAFIEKLKKHPLTPCQRSCPHCKVDMFAVIAHDIEIDWCTQCQGIWLDQGELEKLLQHYPKQAQSVSSDDELPPTGFELLEIVMYGIMKLF